MVTPIQAIEHPLRYFRIIQSIEQLLPLQILLKFVLCPEARLSQKTPPLEHHSLLLSQKLWNPSIRAPTTSSPISAISYATQSFSTFITCNTPHHKQLWIVTDFSPCNPNKSAPLIATVRMCKSQKWSSPSSPTTQWRINGPLLPARRGALKNPNSVHSFKIPIILTTWEL